MIEKTIGAHNIDRSRVFITGLSAGGAMTAAMLATYPEVFAAGAIIAGLPYGAAGNVQQAFESMFQGRPRAAKEWGDLVRGASRHRGPLAARVGVARRCRRNRGADECRRPDPAMDRRARHRGGAGRETWSTAIRAGSGAATGSTWSSPTPSPAWRTARRLRPAPRGLRQGRAVPARGGNFVILSHREVLRSDRHGARAGAASRAQASVVPLAPDDRRRDHSG